MKKKLLSLVLVAAMGLSMLVGCTGPATNPGGNSQNPGTSGNEELDYTGVEIKVWVANEVVEFTNQQIEAWKTANPEMKDIVVTVEAVGEGDAAGKVTTDVVGSADIYGFAQDQIARLVAADALMQIGGDYATAVKTNNDAGSVGAATVADKIYAFPLTSDNGYFMYYDKTVITDVSSLDNIIAQCETAGKNFHFELNSAWYNAAFFFAAGCKADYTTAQSTDAEGEPITIFDSSDITYASNEGVAAVKAMMALAASKAFVNGSAVDGATNAAVIVSGTWNKKAATELFGENLACAKLPTATIDGKQVQLSGMGGFKLLGVKPQTDRAKASACLSLANFLSSEAAQLARFNAVGWGPSNLNAQKNDAVASDIALKALGEQLAFSVPQGQYPDGFWSDVQAMGDSIKAGEYAGLTDAQILEKLQTLQGKLESYVTKVTE